MAEARSQGSSLSRAQISNGKATWAGPGPPLIDGTNGGGPGKQGEHASMLHNVIEYCRGLHVPSMHDLRSSSNRTNCVLALAP
jgi:hypothetical protein